MLANKLRCWVNAQVTAILKYNLFAQLPASTSKRTFDVNLSQHNQICVNYLVSFSLNCCSESQDSATVVLSQQRCASHGHHDSNKQVLPERCHILRFKWQIWPKIHKEQQNIGFGAESAETWSSRQLGLSFHSFMTRTCTQVIITFLGLTIEVLRMIWAQNWVKCL